MTSAMAAQFAELDALNLLDAVMQFPDQQLLSVGNRLLLFDI